MSGFPKTAVYFPHDAAWDGLERIAAHDAVYAQWWDSGYVDALHADNPACQVFPYGNACELRSDPSQGPEHVSNVELAAASVRWILPQLGGVLTEAMDASQTHFHTDHPERFTIGDRVICDDEIMYCVDNDSGVVYVQRDWLKASSAHDAAAYIYPAFMQYPGSVTMNLGAACEQADVGAGLERWSDYNARRMAEMVASAAWDGAYIDVSNPGISRVIGMAGAASANSIDMWYEESQRTDAAIDAAWDAGMEAFQDALHTALAGKPILTNGSAPHYDAMNGTLFEAFPDSSVSVPGGQYQRTWHRVALGPNVFEMRDLGSVADWCAYSDTPGLTSVLCYDDDTGYGTTANEQKRRFAIGTALLFGAYITVAYSPHHIGEDPIPWPEEYDNAGRGTGYLGDPTGAAACLLPALTTTDLIDGVGALDDVGAPTGSDLLGGAGSFAGAGDVAAWSLYYGALDPPHYGHAANAYEAVAGEGYMRVDVDVAADGIDQILAYYNIGSVVGGKKYRLQFDAYASVNVTQIWPTAIQDGSPFDTLIDWAYPDGIILEDTKQTYTLDFRATGSGTVDFRFMLGNVAAGRSVWIGEVTIYDIAEGDLDAWDVSCTSGNAVAVSLETSTQHTGAGCAKIDVIASTLEGVGEAIKFGPIVKSFAVVGGRDYTLKVAVKADADRYIAMVGIGLTGTVQCDFGGFLLTTSWQEFEIPYMALADDTIVLRAWLGKCPAGSTVYLDDVTVQEGNRDLYSRGFDNGQAIVNGTSETQTVAATGYRINGAQYGNDGAAVSSVTIAPRDAVILLRTGVSRTPAQVSGVQVRLTPADGSDEVLLDFASTPALTKHPTWEIAVDTFGFGAASIPAYFTEEDRARLWAAKVAISTAGGTRYFGKVALPKADQLVCAGWNLHENEVPRPADYVNTQARNFFDSPEPGRANFQHTIDADGLVKWSFPASTAQVAGQFDAVCWTPRYTGVTTLRTKLTAQRIKFSWARTNTNYNLKVYSTDLTGVRTPVILWEQVSGSGGLTGNVDVNVYDDPASSPGHSYSRGFALQVSCGANTTPGAEEYVTFGSIRIYDVPSDTVAGGSIYYPWCPASPQAVVKDCLLQLDSDYLPHGWDVTATVLAELDDAMFDLVGEGKLDAAKIAEVCKRTGCDFMWLVSSTGSDEQPIAKFSERPTVPAYYIDTTVPEVDHDLTPGSLADTFNWVLITGTHKDGKPYVGVVEDPNPANPITKRGMPPRWGFIDIGGYCGTLTPIWQAFFAQHGVEAPSGSITSPVFYNADHRPIEPAAVVPGQLIETNTLAWGVVNCRILKAAYVGDCAATIYVGPRVRDFDAVLAQILAR